MSVALAWPHLQQRWQAEVLPALEAFVQIPAKSPHFDPDWQENGHLEAALELGAQFCRDHLPDAAVEIVREPGRTPLLFVEAPASPGNGDGESALAAAGTALIYGHFDKQPENSGWSSGLAPWQPVIRDGKLYGRGAVDDGYALFSAVLALAALRESGQPTPRTLFLIETCEESGSYDLPAYLDRLAERIGAVDLVVCPDAGCGTYDRLWCTTSLRGMITGTLRVDVLHEGVHSGDAGGVVPSSFRILRSLLSRLEDEASGEILPELCRVSIPEQCREQAEHAATVLGGAIRERYPFLEGVRPQVDDPAELLLARSWRAALEIVGAEGLPPVAAAGNVLRPFSALKLALRLPPTAAAEAVATDLQRLLTSAPPASAPVAFELEAVADGWAAPATAPWLSAALERAGASYFGAAPVLMGEGGTIPLMAWLQARFPQAQFLVTGVAGPGSNAHGPDEFLHLDAAQRVTGCLAEALAALAQQHVR
ncbi:peptidase M20 [Halorhodospira abdelmalekii]|uniref:M20/M25/M40 family metallo-hydrolase n=1 Tax=Halorhodospira abdelmalekii TaxID=421629 RepID=UPI00190444F5|nr:M20/M25/M40 family metallo-hydrolase [Halorhodospira abdelmalekii]MBK1734147.1 peptidase M20 [Halorhodospira abdelmalekii]